MLLQARADRADRRALLRRASIALKCSAPAGALLSFALTLALAPGALAQEVPPPPVETPEEAQLVDVEAFLRGEGAGMTAEDAARRAVATGPSIEGTRAQLEVARAGATRAMTAFVPRLELTGRYTRLSEITQPSLFSVTPEDIAAARMAAQGISDPVTRQIILGQIDAQAAQASFTFPVLLDTWSFNAGLTVPVSDLFLQVWPSYEAADNAAQASVHQIRARASEIAQQARETYYSYARARGALAVAQALVAAAELQAEMVSAMVRAGASARVDEVRVRAQVAAARVAEIRAAGGVRVAESALRTILHADDVEPIAISENLLEPLPEVTEPREALVRVAVERRAEVLALQRLILSRSRQIDAAEGSRWPHLALAANLTVANPNQRIFPQTQDFNTTWDISVLVSYSPNDTWTGELQANEARALRAQVEADLRTLEDGIRLQVVQAYETLAGARAAMEAAVVGVEAADETLRVRNEQYRAGATVLTELVLAVNERARAQLDLINAALDARVAYSQLQRAIGADGPYEGIE